MQGAAIKLTALAASLAVGFMFLMQIQQKLDQTKSAATEAAVESEIPAELTLAEREGELTSPQQEPENDPYFQADQFRPNEPTAESIPQRRSPAIPHSAGEQDPFAVFAQQMSDQARQSQPFQDAQQVVQEAQNNAAEIQKFARETQAGFQQFQQDSTQKIQQVTNEVTQAVDQRLQTAGNQFQEMPTDLNPLLESVANSVSELVAPPQEFPQQFGGVELAQRFPKSSEASDPFATAKPMNKVEAAPAEAAFAPLEPPKNQPKSAPAEKPKPTGGFPAFPAPAAKDEPVQNKEEKPAGPVMFPAPGFPAAEKTSAFPNTEKSESSGEMESADTPANPPAFFNQPAEEPAKTAESDDPYRLIPQFNSDNSEAKTEPMKREPAPFQFHAAETEPVKKNLVPETEPVADPFGAAPLAAPDSQEKTDPPAGFPGPAFGTETTTTAPEMKLIPEPESGLSASSSADVPNPFAVNPESDQPMTTKVSQPDASEPTPLKEEELIGAAEVDSASMQSVQQPKIELYKSAPDNAVLGQPLIYSIEVVNTGDVAVRDVVVEDKFPAGTKLTGTIPRAELLEKTLVWKFPELKPAERKKILVRVVPIEPGTVGSISTVTYKSVVATQTVVTAPELQLDVISSTQELAVGQPVQLKFVVANYGAGAAHNVVLRNLIPIGLEHPAGADLEYEIGVLKGGEKKEITLGLLAREPGTFANQSSVKCASGQTIETQTSLKVVPAYLSLTQTGPTRRFVGHAAEFETRLMNNSDRVLTQITLTAQLPAGLEFKSSAPPSMYNRTQHSVNWTIPEIQPRQEVVTKLVAIPQQIGLQSLQLTAAEPTGHRAETTHELKVEGFASLAVRIPDERVPVAIGERVSLRFKVVNRGTAAATNVQVQCQIPQQLQFLSSEGSTTAEQIGNTIQFRPIAELAANQELTFDVVFNAVGTGDTRVEFQVNSEQTSLPLKHQEQVLIYGE